MAKTKAKPEALKEAPKKEKKVNPDETFWPKEEFIRDGKTKIERN